MHADLGKALCLGRDGSIPPQGRASGILGKVRRLALLVPEALSTLSGQSAEEDDRLRLEVKLTVGAGLRPGYRDQRKIQQECLA